MLEYDNFDDRGETRWVSYLMYFHRAGYKSDAINTDRLGFRVSHGNGGPASLGGTHGNDLVARLMAEHLSLR